MLFLAGFWGWVFFVPTLVVSYDYIKHFLCVQRVMFENLGSFLCYSYRGFGAGFLRANPG